MRLTACVPTIPEHIVSSLEICGVKTDADLLFSGSTFEIFRRLPAGTTTLRELARYTALVANLASVPGHSASDRLKQLDDDHFLSGLPELDEILDGLTTPGRLIEISGNKGSGKTSLLLQLVLHHLVHHPQSSVLWIDTTGDFSAARATQFLELHDAPDASLALDRLQVSVAFEIDAVHEALEELRLSLSSGTQHQYRTRAIVVDTVTPLFGPNLSPVSSQGHAIMTGSMRQFRAFAEYFSLTVFVVNDSAAFTPFVPGSVSNNPNIRKPALGPSFTFLTDATLWLALYRNEADPQERDTGIECTLQVYRSKVTVSQMRRFKFRQGVFSACE
ncbi:P-loop containing nucleoside triphosphate hydrolase protein [Mycena sanguinolenta]|nr:P-loop containing nucleoside triphosphate hydrolase protein [Mycena sanguinolenta]